MNLINLKCSDNQQSDKLQLDDSLNAFLVIVSIVVEFWISFAFSLSIGLAVLIVLIVFSWL